MAASDCALRAVLRPGDHIVIPDDAYGGTFRLIDKVFREWGVHHTPVHLADLDAVKAALTAETRMIWVETPTNPLLSIADIAALSDIGHSAGAKVLVDNTFASPALQQPLTLGADIVLHSTTKYIGGHSDVVGGALVTNSEAIQEFLRDIGVTTRIEYIPNGVNLQRFHPARSESDHQARATLRERFGIPAQHKVIMAVGAIMPLTARMVVVLPLPLGPSTAMRSPATSRTASAIEASRSGVSVRSAVWP